ncbi:MAG: DUF222 domain-containing protein, partial [Alphaproteobacteria bacterium]
MTSLQALAEAHGVATTWYDIAGERHDVPDTTLEAVLQAGRCAGDQRTRAQQQADALVQLCDNQLAAGHLPVLRTVKPHVAVVIAAADLTDPATGPGAAELG